MDQQEINTLVAIVHCITHVVLVGVVCFSYVRPPQ